MENSKSVTTTVLESTIPANPRQERFLSNYLEPDSPTFGNAYQSAVSAGFSVQTARNLTHNRPAWLSEKLGQVAVMEPDLLLLKLTEVVNNPREGTQHKLRAIELMMKYYRMFEPDTAQFKISIETVLD